MTIVCGVDLSESSVRAARAAAALCARRQVRLHLLHVVEPSAHQAGSGVDVVQAAREQLRALSASLRSQGADVEDHVEVGAPDQRLRDLGKEVGATLLVVAAAAEDRRGKSHVGSNAYRLVQEGGAPVLIVRDPQPIEAWCAGTRPLRIVLGADLSQGSDTAMNWLGGLREYGPCEVVAVHLYWPPEQFARLGLTGVRDYVEPAPVVTATLAHELSSRLVAATGAMPVKTSVQPHMGRVGDRLAALAQEEQADLIVVGSHARSAFGRLVHGSVSHDLLAAARVSVACVPESTKPSVPAAPLVAVLVATDFSATGDRAVPLAFSMLAPGGVVHLVHVLRGGSPPAIEPHDIFEARRSHSAAEAEARGRLKGLATRYAGAARVEIHVLESNDVARTICQAGERLDVGLICLGTHGLGAARALLGSVTSSVLHDTKRPLLLARTPSE